MSNKTTSFIVGAAVGAAVGYLGGILTAPKSGKETRADIKEYASTVYADREELLKDLKEKTMNSASLLNKLPQSVSLFNKEDKDFDNSMTAKHETGSVVSESSFEPRTDYSEFVDSIAGDNDFEPQSSVAINALRSENEELKSLIDEIKGA